MKGNEFHLKVGEAALLERGFPLGWGPGGKVQVVYSGMPNESVYSLAVLYTSGYNSLSYNLYLPLTQTRIEMAKGCLEAVEATPEYIRFKYVRRSFPAA